MKVSIIFFKNLSVLKVCENVLKYFYQIVDVSQGKHNEGNLYYLG